MSTSRKNLSEIHHFHSSGQLGFGIVTYRPNGRLGPRRQTYIQLVVVHRGHLQLSVNGTRHWVGEGQGILLRPGKEETFQFSETAETEHSWCQIAESEVPLGLKFAPAYFEVPADCSRSFLNGMRRGWRRNPEMRNLVAERLMVSRVLAAMWEFCHGLPVPDSCASPEALLRLARWLEENLGCSVTLAELARAAGISKGHLILLVRRHWQTTPMEYLWQQRLLRAAQLLRETGLSISEVADRTGFDNPFHFSRRFKQRFGNPPRLWRASQWRGA